MVLDLTMSQIMVYLKDDYDPAVAALATARMR
jgi:hypothetical protein